MSSENEETVILVVDDSEYQRSRACKLLKENGFEIIEAHDGLEGVWLFRQEQPDLVIMDINMPIMEGIDAVRYIRQIDRRALVIMFSTLDDEKTLLSAIKAGAADYIVKPLQPELMMNTINKLLEHKRKREKSGSDSK